MQIVLKGRGPLAGPPMFINTIISLWQIQRLGPTRTDIVGYNVLTKIQENILLTATLQVNSVVSSTTIVENYLFAGREQAVDMIVSGLCPT